MKIIFTIILSITFYNLFASNTTNFPPPYFISHSNIDKTVTGIVTDENGAPLEFVSIGVKGTNNGTYSDESGKFSILVPDNAILVFSYVGYESVEISVNNQNNLNIKMVSNVKLLDQVVVIGYGTAKRIDLTGSSNKIKGAELAAVPYLTATQLYSSLPHRSIPPKHLQLLLKQPISYAKFQQSDCSIACRYAFEIHW